MKSKYDFSYEIEKMEKAEKVAVSIAQLISFLLLVPILILDGWVLSWIWLWFIVPVFPVPALSAFQATGVYLTARFLCAHVALSEKKDTVEIVFLRIAKAVIFPLLTLGICWVIFHFVIN